MQHSKIKIAIIGTGHRAEVVMELLKQFREKVEIPVVYDPDYTRSEKYIKDLFLDGTIIARSYQEAIDYPGIEWVMVFSPNAFHCEHVLAAFKRGNMFFQKNRLLPLCKTARRYMMHIWHLVKFLLPALSCVTHRFTEKSKNC